MGHYTYSDICHNVLYLGPVEELYETITDLEEEDLYEPGCSVMRGWSLSNYNQKCGKDGELYADELSKGDHKVFLINSSYYSHVGEYDYYVFSDDPSAVAEFLNDFKDLSESTVIKDVDSVMFSC